MSTRRTIGNEKRANLFIKSTFFNAFCGTKLAIAANSLFQMTGAVPKKVSTLSIPNMVNIFLKERASELGIVVMKMNEDRDFEDGSMTEMGWYLSQYY